MIPSFVPSNGPLVVRTGMGMAPENHRKTHHVPTTMKDFAGAKANNGTKARFGQLSQSSFFARHNPQPNRVRHIKGLLDLPICAVNDRGYMSNPRLTLRRPATHGGEDLALRWSYPMSGPRTAPAGGRLLPVHSVNYHPNHSNPSLQRHHVNYLDASKNYRRFPFTVKERADPNFGMSLLDIPICAVHDDGHMINPRLYVPQRRPHTSESSYERYRFRNPRLSRHKLQFYGLNETLNSHRYPTNTITGLSMFPMGCRERASSAGYGMIPITESWRDELRYLTERAGLGLPKEEPKEQQPVKRTSVYSAETGRLIPPPSRAMSRGFSRQKQRDIRGGFVNLTTDQENEGLVLEMLCQILQTDNISAVQSWLISSGDREKDLVLDMIQSAIATEETYYNQENGNQDYYDRRGGTGRPLTTEYRAPTAEINDHTGIPNMMNVQNGYGELDRPVPPSRDQQVNAYSRYGFSRDGERSKLGTAKQLDTIYDDQADHPSLRQPSSKSDVFRVEHSPRSQSKAEVMKIIHPPSPPTQRRSTAKKSQLDSSSSPTPPNASHQSPPKVRYAKSALDVRDEDLKKHTLASILKEDRLSAKSAREENTQR